MPISRSEAAQMLKDIESTQGRSFQAFGYRRGAPFLILWGVIWMLGYGGVEFAPRLGGLLWTGLGIFGAIVSTLIGMRMKPAGQAKFDWRIAGTWFTACCFISAMFAIVAPVSGLQVGALIPLLIAWAYVVMGFWLGARYLVAGLIVTAVTLGGYFWWPQHFAGLMAVVGGGTLILTGLWLRKA